MGFHVDDSELQELGRDLGRAPGRAERESSRVMKRGALEVKKRMQEDFSGHRYAGKVPGSLEFQQLDAGGLFYEVGELDSAGPQWGIAAILAFGTSNNAPVVDHTASLRGEESALDQHLGAAGEDAALGDRG